MSLFKFIVGAHGWCQAGYSGGGYCLNFTEPVLGKTYVYMGLALTCQEILAIDCQQSVAKYTSLICTH